MSLTAPEPVESLLEPSQRHAPISNVQQDIAELRSRLAAETAEKDRLQRCLDLRNAALDAAATYFMIVDAKLEHWPIAYANRALAVQHGFSGAHDLVGKPVSILLDKFTSGEAREQFSTALAEGRPVGVEFERIDADGSVSWVGLTTFPIVNAAGEATHHVTLGADITARLEEDRKRRALQERLYSEMQERERMSIELRLAQKLESVGRLAAGLAHEINTPIQYVGDSVYFLRSAFEDLSRLFAAYKDAAVGRAADPECERTISELKELETAIDFEFLSAEVPKAFERTMEGADRVAAIVRAMREFAHPDGNEQSPADINHALTTTLMVARSEYRYAAAVSTRFADLPPVLCNIGELNQVFLNLIVNAAHAIADSGKDVETGLIQIDTRVDGEHVEIVIEDNGCGIPQANLDKIFDPFFTTKEVGRGTGQGLAIARAIVAEKHAGRIEVSSEPEVGTRFVLRLPISRASNKVAV